MPPLPLSMGDYVRTAGRLPHMSLVNMFAETDPTNTEDGYVRLQRAGMSLLVDLGLPAPIRGVWRLPDAFNNDFFVAASNKLKRVTQAGAVSSVGDLNGGTSIMKVAARQSDALFLEDGRVWLYNGATLTLLPTPDDVLISSIKMMNSYYLLSVKDSARFYWIIPGATTIDGLDFATAERETDNLISIATVGDEIWMLGTDSEEVWSFTGNSDTPLQPSTSRATSYGCANADTIISHRNMLYWVTPNGELVRGLGIPQVISDYSTSEWLRKSDLTQARAWVFVQDQHVFYVLTTDLKTLAIDITAKLVMPSVFKSYNMETWRAHLGAQRGKFILCGASDSSKLFVLDPSLNTDAGDVMERMVSAGIENVNTEAPCFDLTARVAVGWSPLPDFEPTLEMRWSDDEANTWTAWRSFGLGKMGEYNKDVIFRSLGSIKRPGRMFQFRVTDDAVFRISHAHVNADMPGG